MATNWSGQAELRLEAIRYWPIRIGDVFMKNVVLANSNPATCRCRK
jgi:hypothetical protein